MKSNFNCVIRFATKAAASAFTFHLNRRSIRTRQLGFAAIIMPVELNDEEMEIVNNASKYFNAINC